MNAAEIKGRDDRLREWVKDLSPEQMKPLIVELVSFAIAADYVCYWGDSLAPSWDGSGEPLIDGQETHVYEYEDERD